MKADRLLCKELLFVILTILSSTTLKSQMLINQLWEVELNYPDTLPWNATVLNSSNDLFTTGNTFHNATQKVNIVTTKTNSSGIVIWQTEYNGTLSAFDYGSAICIDASGNVYIAGATHNTSAYTFDIVIIKYNSSGTQQWATLFNGAGSGMDIPSGICLDGGGNIYVCGASTGTTTGYDYVTIKLNSSGIIEWSQTYDYASLYDLPGYIAWSSATSKIGIAGASQSSATNWDYTTLKYNSSGTLTNTNRTTTTGYGFDRPTGLVTDASDNFYITGYAFNGTDYDLRTVKLDEDLSPIWTVTKDGGDEDGSNGIAIDGSGNTYISGFATNGQGKQEMQVIKYNSAGTQQWIQTFSNRDNTIDAQAMAIAYNASNSRVVVTGYYKHDSGKKVITTFALAANNGSVIWKTNYPNLYSSIDSPKWITESGNHIWVTGTSERDDTTRYVTIKYETFQVPNDIVFDGEDRPSYLDNQVVVKVNPRFINYEFVDNKQIVYDNLVNVIDDTLFDILEPIINPENQQFTSKGIKIFEHFTTADTVSISRLGDTVDIGKLWSTIIITLPDIVDPTDILDTLNNLGDLIFYAHPNGLSVMQDVPNDFYIDDDMQQEGLLPTISFPGADINMNGAWDITPGEDYIKVGVLGYTIFWQHEDFGDGTFSGSKIAGGYDFWNHIEIEDADEPAGSHETACAGIIGALRNNDVGIAGIAGGDVDGTGSTGVELFSIGLAGITGAGDESLVTVGVQAQAIAEGSIFNPATEVGFGLNIQSFSWVGYAYEEVMNDALTTAAKNNCVVVASRGNTGTDVFTSPACYDDDKVISVGASGTDGSYKRLDNGDDTYASSFGEGVDLIAPGTTELVATTINPTHPFGWDDFDLCEDIPETNYSCFNGSSAAAPHVAGVAALMMSRQNTEQGYPYNLAVEDVENILQNTATDVSGTFGAATYDVGYDVFNGFGLLNATAAVENINLPNYMVFHNSEPVSESISADAAEYVFITAPESGLMSANYFADKYTITRAYSDVFPVTTEILDSWIRWSSTVGTNGAVPVTGIQYADFSFTIVDNVASISVTTYEWHVYETITGADIDVWIPADLDHIRTDYSLHIFDQNGLASIMEQLGNKIIISPNPNDGNFQISSAISEPCSSIMVYNQFGQLCYLNEDINSLENTFTIDITNQPSGIYFVNVNSTSGVYTAKFIKL